MNQRLTEIATGLSCFVLILMAGSVGAAEVTMGADVQPPSALGSISPTGSGTPADPYVYTFSTTNGLDMVTHKIYSNAQQNRHVKLDLNGGDVIAATNGSGQCTSLSFDLKANNVGTEYASGVHLVDANNIRIGKIWTYQGTLNGVGGNHNGGDVTIGTNSSPGRAGKVEISEILTYAGNAYSGASCGNVSINGSSDVFIWDGVNAGDIGTYHPKATGDGGSAGSVTIRHDGALRAREINTYWDSGSRPGGFISLNGDILADGSSGNLQVSALKSYSNGGDGSRGGNVTVIGYNSVTIPDGIYARGGTYGSTTPGGTIIVTGGVIWVGHILTYNPGGNYGGVNGNVFLTATAGEVDVTGNMDVSASGNVESWAGNATINAVGDISIGGTINLNGGTDARDGVLSLTSANGSVTVRDLDCSLFAVGSTNTFDSGSRWSYIMGALSNFDYTNSPATQIRAATGQSVFYLPKLPGNEYLASAEYPLVNGGKLRPLLPSGTVICIR